jgi:cellobiose-specific phosphotransferase system component IIB
MNSREYIEWILSQKQEGCTIAMENEDHAVISSEHSDGEVQIYHLECDIVELRLADSETHENYFFLHFELKEEEHARGLFREMMDALKKHTGRTSVNVLLSCTSGFTTSFFAEKLNEAAAMLSLDYQFSATAFSGIHKVGFDADVILLAPQIAWQLKKAKEVFEPRLVLAIPAAAFASYDAGAVIQFVQAELLKKQTTKEEIAIARLMRDIDTSAVMFVINMVHDKHRTRYYQRLYEAGNVIFTEEIIKERNSRQDLTDILDTQLRAIRQKFSVDAVSISVPGILVGEEEVRRVDYEELSKNLSEHCGLPVYVFHNTVAVAYGYYAQQGKYDIVCYHSQPAGTMGGGTGTVYRGMPVNGRNQMAGELDPIFRMQFPQFTDKVTDVTPQDVKNAVVFYLAAAISEFAPEVILVRSALTPDMEELKEELKKYMREQDIPDLIHVRDIGEYALLGTMLYGMHRFKGGVTSAALVK